eukprot:g3952.t1
MTSTVQIQLEPRDSVADDVDDKTKSSRGWKDVDLRKPELWEVAETQNICARAVITLYFSDDVRYGDDFSNVWTNQVTPCLANITQECNKAFKDKKFRTLSAELEKAINTADNEFKIYCEGPKEEGVNGEQWVTENCGNLKTFLAKYFNGYQLCTNVYSKGDHRLEVLGLVDMLVDVFGVISECDCDKTKALGYLSIRLGINQIHVLETLGEAISKIVSKAFKGSEEDSIQYDYQIVDAVVANKDRTTSCLGFCPKTKKIILSNPVSGRIEPFLVPSPRKVEKYILRKGSVHKRVIGPHCRAAFSYNDLSLKAHRDWSEKNDMKLQNLPKRWDVDQVLQPLSLHKRVKTSKYDYDEADVVKIEEINKKRHSAFSSNTGNSKGGKEEQSIVGPLGKLAYRPIEEAILSMQIGEVALLKVKDPDVDNGKEKYFHVQNEGFVEEECGNDCIGCEEGLLLVTETSDGFGFRGIGEYQACKLCYAGCTCQSCKSLIKCLLSCSACFAGCGVIVSDALN